jgi:hypothetical protein
MLLTASSPSSFKPTIHSQQLPISKVFPPSTFCSWFYSNEEQKIQFAPVTVVLTEVKGNDFDFPESCHRFLLLITSDCPFVHDCCVLENDLIVEKDCVRLTHDISGVDCLLTAYGAV